MATIALTVTTTIRLIVGPLPYAVTVFFIEVATIYSHLKKLAGSVDAIAVSKIGNLTHGKITVYWNKFLIEIYIGDRNIYR